jgi:hypothetical protein
MKRTAAKMPLLNAIPETMFGEAACKFADEIGIPVSTYALRGERPMTTTGARAYLAKGKADGYDFASGVWVVTAYRIT